MGRRGGVDGFRESCLTALRHLDFFPMGNGESITGEFPPMQYQIVVEMIAVWPQNSQ